MGQKARIRLHRPGNEADERAAYYICLKTGDHGGDGEPLFPEDPDALGRVYVGPYLAYAPHLALLLEDEQGVCGYALGVEDSRAFYDWYGKHWRPRLCKRFPEPRGDPAQWTPAQQVYRLYHHPDYFCPEPYALYPAHLHIDLLPRAQGRGYGRKMMEELLGRLRKRGAPGVHLGVSARNRRAYGFYRKLGFQELTRRGEGADAAIYMGKSLS